MATVRQKKAIKILAGKGGKTVAKAMREAGYSEAMARHPAKLTKSKSWAELMDEFLPRDLVAKQHRGLLEAEETMVFGGKKYKKPDFQARAKGIDMAYKLRGEFAPEKMEFSKRKFQAKSNEELERDLEEKRKMLFKGKKQEE